jgi:hypothetical protein
MLTKLLRIEVSDTNVTVYGSVPGEQGAASTLKPLGMFPGGVGDLPALISQIGEPHETEQVEGRYVMTWRLAPGVRSFAIGRRRITQRVARGSQTFTLEDEDPKSKA